MYAINDKMWFAEDEDYIESLSKGSEKRVKCICPLCGKEKMLNIYTVRCTGTTVCHGCSYRDKSFRKIDGKRFNRLVVIGKAEQRNGQNMVFCRCDCGAVKSVSIQALKSGATQSCGCLNREITSSKKGVLNKNFGKRGEESANYNQNISNEQREMAIKERRNPEAIHFRKQVRERDGACVICDSTENLVVHHLNSFRDFEELRYDIENGVTLCRFCHTEFHCTWMGHFKNVCTEQDFNEYVLQV